MKTMCSGCDRSNAGRDVASGVGPTSTGIRRSLKIAARILTLVALLSPTGLAGQTINSNPEFLRAGPKAYACRTPKGRRVMCNKWFTANRYGWLKSCTKPGQSVFSRLSDSGDAAVMLGEDETNRQCVYLFDEALADYHRVFKNQKRQAREDTRQLKPAQLKQFVEVKEPGTYELSACVAREVFDFELDPEYDSMIQEGGLTVSLIQWHKDTTDQPTHHLTLPEHKAKFGVGGSLVDAKDFDLTIGPDQDMPSYETLGSGPIVGRWAYVNEFYPGLAHLYTIGGGTTTYEGYGRHLYYADGFDGHAGLQSQYKTAGSIVDTGDGPTEFSQWTCHKGERYLEPGFYLIQAEIRPTWLGELPEYFGFAAIKNIQLERVEQ